MASRGGGGGGNTSISKASYSNLRFSGGGGGGGREEGRRGGLGFLTHLSLKTSCSIGKTPCGISLSHPRDLLIPST